MKTGHVAWQFLHELQPVDEIPEIWAQFIRPVALKKALKYYVSRWTRLFSDKVSGKRDMVARSIFSTELANLYHELPLCRKGDGSSNLFLADCHKIKRETSGS